MTYLKWKFPALLFIALLSFTACEEKSESEKAADKIENTSEEIGDLFRTEQEELQHDLKEASEKIEKKMQDLNEDLANASGDARAKINDQMAKLEKQRKALAEDLDRTGDQIADNWKEFKTNVRQQLDEIDRNLENIN